MAASLDQSVLKMNYIVLFIVYFGSIAQGDPQIVEPYPKNVYAIENEKAKVTCVVEDTHSNPDKIVFVRKNQFGDTTLIYDEGPDGRIYYQNETLGNGSKLLVTLHFNKIVRTDDSRNNDYECHGYTGSKKGEFGFTVTVIERKEFPEIHVAPDNVTAKIGDRIVLFCNLTMESGSAQTKLTKWTWAKDGTSFIEIYCPREHSLKPLVINVDNPDKGGIYTCFLEYKLRNVLQYNNTKNIIVEVKAKIEEDTSSGQTSFQNPLVLLGLLFGLLLQM